MEELNVEKLWGAESGARSYPGEGSRHRERMHHQHCRRVDMLSLKKFHVPGWDGKAARIDAFVTQ